MAVLELGAGVRLHHAPGQLEVAPPRPFRIVGQAGLGGGPAHQRDRAHHRLAGEVGVGASAVGAERVEDVATDVAEGLGAGPGGDAPAVARRGVEGLAQVVDQLARGGARRVRLGEDPNRVAQPEGTHLRRGVGDVATQDEMLDQGQPRVVERQVGRRLCRQARGCQHAAQERGAEDAGGGGHGGER